MLNFTSHIAGRVMTSFFSCCREQRFTKSSKAFEENTKPVEQNVEGQDAGVKHEQSHYSAIYSEFKKQAEAIFIYPFENPHQQLVRQIWSSLAKERDISRKKRIISFGPMHPATQGVLRMLLQRYVEETPKFGIKLSTYKLYLRRQLQHDQLQNFDFNDVPLRLANERQLALSAPRHVDHIHSMFSNVMQVVDPSGDFGISAAVLDCGNLTLLFWLLEKQEKLTYFCRLAASTRMNSVHMKPGRRNVNFPLGFCHDLFEFPYRFIHDIEELERVANNYRMRQECEGNLETKLNVSARIYDTCTKRRLKRLQKMREASRILFNCLQDGPPNDGEADDFKLLEIQLPQIQRSVELLINHFQNYNRPNSFAMLDALSLRENAQEPNFGVTGLGWYIASLPKDVPLQ